MNALLICASDRPQVSRLAEYEPLCAIPMAGRSLIETWLTTLAIEQVSYVLVLADDRVEQIEALTQEGKPWGMHVEIRKQTRELTPAQALLTFQEELGQGVPNKNVAVLDHFPGLAQFPLFMTYAGWFSGLMAWLPRARTPDRVGIRELQPGIWTGLNARVSPKAELRAPCWVGERVIINDRCLVGPGTIIERGSMIDSDAKVTSSYIGPDTYVGRYSDVDQSIARGGILINWQSACAIRVPDRFVLSALRQPQPPVERSFNTRLANRWKTWFAKG